MYQHYVYILECADGSYYTGYTHNLEMRIKQHQNKYVINCYTAKRLPIILLWSTQVPDLMQALSLEKQIKGWTRRKKEALIAGDTELLKLLSKNYTEFPCTKDL